MTHDPQDRASAASNPPRWTRFEIAALAAILLLATTFRVVLLDRPFGRNAEGMGAFYGVLARNYLRHGWQRSLGVPVQSMGDRADLPLTLYSHHPPLVPLLIAGSYAALGQGDWQTRLPTALFTLGSIGLLHLLLRRRGHVMAGLVASALLAAMPMSLYYGGQPDCINSQLVFFMLLTLASYQSLHAAPSAGRLALMALAFTGAACTDWPAFFIVPVVCLHYVLTRPRRQWPWVVGLGLYAVVIFALLYGQIALAVEDWRWMSDKVARRALSNQSDRATSYGAAEWLSGIWRHNRTYHTIPVVALAGLWIALRSWRRGGDAAITLARLALFVGLLHVLIGRQGVLVHDWWWWVVTPGLAMAAGLAVEWLANALAQTKLRRVAVFGSVVGLCGFAGWTTWTIWPQFFGSYETHGGLDYSTVEVGEAIRLAGPDVNSAVVYCYEQTYDLPLWYYADRPLKLDVWDMQTLQWRIRDGVADLSFGFTQPWPDPPVGLVLPRQFVPAVPEFAAELRQRYRCTELPRFLVFDLTAPPEAPQ